MAKATTKQQQHAAGMNAFCLGTGEQVPEPANWNATWIFPTADEAAPDRLRRLIKHESELIVKGMQRITEAEERRRKFVAELQRLGSTPNHQHGE